MLGFLGQSSLTILSCKMSGLQASRGSRSSDDEEDGGLPSSQSGPSCSKEEGFAVQYNKKGNMIPGLGRNYRIIPGKQEDSRIFMIDADLYVFEKLKDLVPGEPATFYMACKHSKDEAVKCKARATISCGFMTRDPSKPHTCNTAANRVFAEVSIAFKRMKERAATEKTGFLVN